MSFIDCILSNDLLSNSQKEKLTKEYNDRFLAYRKSMGATDAAAKAAEHYVSIKASQLSQKKLNTFKDVIQWKEHINPKLKSAAAAVKADKDKAGMGAFLFGNPYLTAARGFLEDTYTKTLATERTYTIAISDIIEKYRSKFAGLQQDTAGFKNVVRALLGDTNVDDIAKKEAEAIRRSFDAMHKRYKTSGGIMGYLENYFPQAHNHLKVGKAAFREWADFIKPLIDLDKMIDFDTGLPMTMEKLDKMLPDIYEGIKTNGLNELAERAEKGMRGAARGGGLAQRRALSRFFKFKDADSFLAYNTKFGNGDEGLFSSVMHHIHSMSRDITLLEEMGPKPEAVIDRMILGSPTGESQTLRGMYDVMSGATSFNGEMPVVYRAVENLQNYLRSTLLGSAPVSAMSDTFYQAYTAKMNGLPIAKVIGNYFSFLNPLNDGDRMIARRISVIAGASSGHSLKGAMQADDAAVRGVFGWMANFTNRASGLASMTDGAKSAIQMSTMGFLDDMKLSGILFDDLPMEMKDAFKRWGMDESDYAKMMTVKSTDIDGATFLTPEDLATSGHLDTARKYNNWLTDMSQSASNEPRLLTRFITTGGLKKNDWKRWTVSSVMMFKSFGITVMLNHFLPAIRKAATGNGIDRFSRIGTLIVGTGILGAAVIQARDVMNGKTPRDMSGNFWQAALLQGGGFGILGDFIFSDQSRFNRNLLTTLAGPVAGFASDLFRIFKGNFDKALDSDQESKFFADLYQFAKRNVPMVKLWYTRLFLERLVLDQAERLIDSNFDKRMRRTEMKMKKENNQEWWWRPGQAEPSGF